MVEPDQIRERLNLGGPKCVSDSNRSWWPQLVVVVATAALGLVTAFGRHLPGVERTLQVFDLLLPFRYPVKALLLTGVSLPLLAAFGIEELCRGRAPTSRRLVSLFALLAVIADLGLAHRNMLWTASPTAMTAGRPVADFLHREAAQAGLPLSQWRLHHHRTPSGVLGPRVPTGHSASREDWFRWQMAMLMPLSGLRHSVSHGREAAIHNLEPIPMFCFAAGRCESTIAKSRSFAQTGAFEPSRCRVATALSPLSMDLLGSLRGSQLLSGQLSCWSPSWWALDVAGPM